MARNTMASMEGEEDLRLKDTEEGKQEDTDNIYQDMINEADEIYNEKIQATEDWAQKQQQIQNEQTDFAIEQIEQQKAQAEKDYLKEQSGAYVDWQKQSAQHGVNAEKMAAAGMQGTGYSESSQVSMYNTYQNRVAVAKESFSRATLNYNNAITQARMQNNAALAEIAYNAYQQQLAFSLEAFQYKNTLVFQMEEQKRQAENDAHAKWLDEQKLLLQEKALEEERRQFDETMAFNREKALGANGIYFGEEEGGGINNTGATEVDMQSLIDLGLGMLSPEQAMELVEQGVLETYVKGGVLYFRMSDKNKSPAQYVAGMREQDLTNRRNVGGGGF